MEIVHRDTAERDARRERIAQLRALMVEMAELEEQEERETPVFGAWKVFINYPFGFMGWQHWERNPSMAVCYSLTFGLCLVGWFFFDPVMMMTRGADERPSIFWRIVAPFHSLYLGYTVSNTLVFAGERLLAGWPPVFFATAGTVLAMHAAGEVQMVGIVFICTTVGIAAFMSEDVWGMNPYWAVWLFLRIKNDLLARIVWLFVPHSLLVLDSRFEPWPKAKLRAHREFLARNTDLFRSLTPSIMFIQLAMVAKECASKPGVPQALLDFAIKGAGRDSLFAASDAQRDVPGPKVRMG